MKLFDLMDFHQLPRRPILMVHARPLGRILQHIFQHQWFIHFGNMVTFANVVCITVLLVEAKTSALAVSSPLFGWNMVFIAYYIVDTFCKIWSQGWDLYLFS